MKVLVDTCIWSLALRYKQPDKSIEFKLKEIIKDGRLVIIGSIRQEILSGISKPDMFETLKEYLDPFEDIILNSIHFVKAAEFSNVCLQKGIQGSNTDFLICSVAYLENLNIFTTDKDFINYKKYLPISLLDNSQLPHPEVVA
jgi:predicted nucleic acid-binding protein